MHFIYKATNKEGKTQEGESDAVSKEALVSSLNRQGIHPFVVKASSIKGSFLSQLKLGKKVKSRDLVIFTRQLSTMISAGVPIARSMATLQQQSQSKYFRTVVSTISKDIESGAPLGDAFARFPNVFSDIYVNMVRAGEAGGILDDILKRLASQVEQDASIRKKIIGAMTYPMVILTITTVAFFGIMIFLMPKLATIIKGLEGTNAKLPIYTRILLAISGFMQHNVIIILVGLFIVIFGIRYYIRTPAGKYHFHALLLKIPILKTIVTKIAVARFSRTFASLMSAGVGVLEALEVTGKAIGNKVIQADLEQAAKEVKNGKQLSEPLSKSKHFPPIVSQMLAVGEETGKIDMVLVKVADFYEEEVETTIDSLSSIIEPLMIIVLGSIVGIIAASVMGPIASLNKNIGTN
jgi:type IV pilus assembly protein PilC